MSTVLFVCVENTFRSVLSEALFNASPPSGWRAESAGVQAAAAINPVVVDLLQEIGIRLGPKTPRTVTLEMIARASRVVTFGCLDRCPVGAKDKGEDWPIPGATGKSMEELRAIRDELRRRIADLQARLPSLADAAKPRGRGPRSGRRRRHRRGEKSDSRRPGCVRHAPCPAGGVRRNGLRAEDGTRSV